MANNEGIGAALEIDDKTIEAIGKVETQLVKLNETADKLVATFTGLSDKTRDFSESLDSKKTEQVAKALDDVASAVNQISKSGAALQGTTEGLENLGNASRRIDNPFAKFNLKDIDNDLNAMLDLLAETDTEIADTKRAIANYDFGSDLYESEKERLQTLIAQSKMVEQQIVDLQNLRNSVSSQEFNEKDWSAYYDRLEEYAVLEKLSKKEYENYLMLNNKEKEQFIKSRREMEHAATDSSSKMTKSQQNAYDRMTEKAEKAGRKLAKAFEMPDSTVEETKKKINAIEKAVESAQDVINKAQKKGIEVKIEGLDDVDEQLDETKDKLNQLYQVSNNVVTALASVFSIKKAVDFWKEVINVRSEFQMIERSLGVIIHDTARSTSMFAEISKIAIQSPFSVQEIASQTKQLAAYRIETEKLIDTVGMLGDISAGVGVDMNRLILAYGQVKAAEYLRGQELRQFSEAGVNMLGGLADRFTEIYGRAVSVGEVMSMISKKMVSFADVEAVLQKETSAGGAFYKMQEIQAQTIQGQMTNLKDRVQISLNEIGKNYEGLVTKILGGLSRIASNYKTIGVALSVFSGATLPLAGFSLLSVLLGKLGTSASFLAVKGEELGKKLVGWGATLARLAPTVTLVTAALGALVGVIINATKETRELNKIENRHAEDVAELEGRYIKLTNTIQDNTKSNRERQAALDALKSEYGNLFDLEDIELSNVGKLTAAYNQNIATIRLRAAEQVKAEQIAVLMSNQREVKARKVINALSRAGINDFEDFGDSVVAEMEAIGSKILDGEISDVQEALNAYADSLRGYFKDGSKELDNFNSKVRIFNGQNSILNYFAQYFKLRDKIARVNNRSYFGENESESFKKLKKEIDAAKKALEEYQTENADLSKAEYTLNFKDYVAKMRSQLEDDIRNSNLGETEANEINRQLNEALNKIEPDKNDIYVAKYQDEINREFKGIKLKIGEGVLGKGATQSYEDYFAGLFDKLDEFKKDYQRSWADGATNKGFNSQFISKDEAEEQIKALEKFLSRFKEYKKEKKGLFSSSKNPFEDFSKELVKAYKDIDEKDAQSMQSIEDRMTRLAKSLTKEGLPFSFLEPVSEKDITDYIKSLGDKGKITVDLSLELSEEIHADTVKKQVKRISDEADALFKKYNTGKKFIDYGLEVDAEYDSVAIIGKIMDKENALRAMKEKEATEQADKYREQRIALVASEQEEALNIIKNSQKKSSNEVQAILNQGMVNISKVRLAQDRASNGEDPMGLGADVYKVNEVVAKTFRDIADAEWEAYKKTEMYVAAFGDLEGLSRDVVESLRKQLDDWSQSAALDPSEIKTVQNALDKMDERLSTKEIKGYFSAISDGFKSIREARDIESQLDEMSDAVKRALDEFDIAKKYEEQLKAAKQEIETSGLDGAFVDNVYMTAEQVNNALNAAILKSGDAYDKASKKLKEYTDAQREAHDKRANAAKSLNAMSQAFGLFTDAVSSSIGFVRDFADAMGLSFDDETNEALDAFVKGFGLVGTAIAAATSMVTAFALAVDAGIIAVETLETLVWPLIAVSAVIGGIAAAISIADNKAKKDIESHKAAVESLEKQYDKLQDKMDKALSMSEMKEVYDNEIKNIRQRITELNEAIETENARKGHKKEVAEEIKDMQEQIEELTAAEEEAKDKMAELLGMPTDYQDIAQDWAKSWLDAFKSGESGLQSLQDSFNDLYDNLVTGQLWSKVMGDSLKELQARIDAAMSDNEITASEAETIKAYRDKFVGMNEELKELANELGVEVTRDSDNSEGLQKGIQSITETTANALESLLNSTRYFVADTNAKVAEIALVLTSDVESGMNPMLNELRSQTTLITRIDERLASIIGAGHPKGGDGIRIFVD